MKTFKFILINKSNMKALNHVSTVERAADLICRSDFSINPNNWIVIKDENKIVNLSALDTYGGDAMTRYRKLFNILEEA